MIAAFGRLTLGSTKPTKWTFLIPILAGLIAVPIVVVDPILGFVFNGGTLSIWVGTIGALYLFFFGHFRRALVFFAGGMVGGILGFFLYIALQSLFH